MRVLVLACFGMVLLGCGKIAEDVTSQSTQSIFKDTEFNLAISSAPSSAWAPALSTSNATPLYGYYEGLLLNEGFEKIGWANAHITPSATPSSNIPTIKNFDQKKNTVTSARYHQGFIGLSKISTTNFLIKTKFNKIRPKFDYYSFYQYISKDVYSLHVSDRIPSQSVTITDYEHIVSATFLKHLKKESWDEENIIPLSVFYDIIPTNSTQTTQNIRPNNQAKSFDLNQPTFSYSSVFFESLLDAVTLTFYSNHYDATDYVKNQPLSVFNAPIKSALLKNISLYFESRADTNATGNAQIDS